MADALVSPAVGGTMWGCTAGLVAWSAKRVEEDLDERRVPLMGVMGAFVFAAQMLNFSIPGTGSSGHLGGGLLLAAVLGPHAAFLVMASILLVQALLFADGGLVAYGCNVVNLGFFSCLVAYPMVFRPLARGRRSLWVASILAAVVGLQLGAFGVVVETTLSGISALPFATFVSLMQPIHLAIGVVEGMATAAVLAFIQRTRPQALTWDHHRVNPAPGVLLVVFLLMAGVASWFASTHPDGLEWAIGRITGSRELAGPQGGLHRALASFQERVALMPDYSVGQGQQESGPVNPGTSLAGILGGLVTLAVAWAVGHLVRRRGSGRGAASAG